MSARAQQLVLDALRLDGGRPVSAEISRMQAEDWHELSRLAALHRLKPMLHRQLAGDQHVAQLPAKLREEFQTAHRKHTLRNLKIYRELVTVTRLLSTEGIPSIALKGSYLACFAYPEPGLRPMRDLDLLLHPEQAVAAFKLLVERGYESVFGGMPEAYFADRIHLPPLRGQSGITVELHHRLTPPDTYTGQFEKRLWAHGVERQVGSDDILFPCAEDMLLHLCIHASQDHLFDLGPLALLDVALLIAAEPVDWPAFISNTRGGGWQRCVLPVLYLARRHLGAAVPDEVIAELGGGEGEPAWLASAEFLLFSDPEDHKLLDYEVQDMLYSASLKDRLGKLWSAAFPPRTVIARHFPVASNSPVAYLYYPRRWYRLLTERLPGLLRAHSGRTDALRQLAGHRAVLTKWLVDED